MSPRVPVSGPLPPVEVIVDRIGRLEDRLDLRSDGRTRLLPVTKAFPVEAVAAVRRAGVREVGGNWTTRPSDGTWSVACSATRSGCWLRS